MMPDQPTLADVLAAVERLAAPQLMTSAAASRFVGVGRRKFFALVSAGTLPRPVQCGDSRMWRRSDIELAVSRLKPGRRKRAG